MFKALPKHLLWAAVSGAVVGPLLYWLKDVQFLPPLLLFVIMAALWVNAAVMPVALPGKHWSFAFIGAVMLFLALVAAMILAPKFPFGHSLFFLEGYGEVVYIPEVNAVTWVAIVTGACLGLFYGLVVGQTPAMVLGVLFGFVAGYFLGAMSPRGFGEWIGVPKLLYSSPLHFLWQGALAMLVLHLGACVGAAMGAGSGKKP
jgi:hypothetical protein